MATSFLTLLFNVCMMTFCQYKQIIGRAGRAGLATEGESILILKEKDQEKVVLWITC